MTSQITWSKYSKLLKEGIFARFPEDNGGVLIQNLSMEGKGYGYFLDERNI